MAVRPRLYFPAPSELLGRSDCCDTHMNACSGNFLAQIRQPASLPDVSGFGDCYLVFCLKGALNVSVLRNCWILGRWHGAVLG